MGRGSLSAISWGSLSDDRQACSPFLSITWYWLSSGRIEAMSMLALALRNRRHEHQSLFFRRFGSLPVATKPDTAYRV